MSEPVSIIAAPVKEDHRKRVAREKRERMHTHLLDSVLATCGNASEPAVINDVVEHARVSRGTFYKHFNSIDEAIEELGGVLADEMTLGIYGIYDVLIDARARTATGVQLFLNRAWQDNDWGAFVAHIGLLGMDNRMTANIAADIRHGVESGVYRVQSVESATDLLIGAKIEAMRRIISDRKDQAYIREVTEMILRAFGTPVDEAAQMVAAMAERLEKEAPTMLDWWKR